MLELKAFSFTGQLHHFLEERDELLFNLLRFFIRDFAINQRIRHELLDVGERRCNVCTFRYRLTFLAVIYSSLYLL